MQTVCNKITLKSLKSDTSYQIRLWEVFPDGFIFGPSLSNVERTNAKKHEPLQVPELVLSDLTIKEDKYEAIVQWKPAKGMIVGS